MWNNAKGSSSISRSLHLWGVSTTEDNSADIAIAGWSICYLGRTDVAHWQDNIHSVISEMKRVIRQGGMLFILETTGIRTTLGKISISEVSYGFNNFTS